jgi:hypothetical protein
MHRSTTNVPHTARRPHRPNVKRVILAPCVGCRLLVIGYLFLVPGAVHSSRADAEFDNRERITNNQ